MKVIIIEDEAPAAERLKKMLSQTPYDIEVVQLLSTFSAARAWLGMHPLPDLIFMDIRLSDGLSIDLFKLTRIDCPVVFITAYDEYWREAFEYNSIDYLLKPLKLQRLLATLDKFNELKGYFIHRYRDLLAYHESDVNYKNRFLVRRGIEYVPIKTSEISFFCASNKLVCLVRSDGSKFILDDSLSEIEKKVDPALFYRVNRKYLVSLQAIRKIHSLPKSKLIIEVFPSPNEEVVISQENSSGFKNWIGGVLRLIIFAIVFVCSSCGRPSLAPHYSELMFDSALALGNRGRSDEAVRLVDGHFATFPEISVIDRYRYYRFRFELYDSYYSRCYDPTKALSYADSMVWLLKTRGLTGRLPREYAAAYNLQGQIYVEMKRYSEAFRVYGFCRLIAEKTGDSCMVAQYNSTMGTVRFRQGEYGEAMELYKRALAEEEACKPDASTYHDVQGCLDNIALAYTRAGGTDSALVYYRKAEKYITEKKYLYTTDTLFPEIALAVVYGNEALAVQEAGDYAGAEALLKKGMAINNLPGRDNPTGVIEELHLAALYLQEHRNGEAFILLQETADRWPRDDEGTKKLWLSLMWQYHEATGNPAKAVAYLTAGLRLSDSMALKDRHRFAGSEDNIYQLLEAQYQIELLQKNSTIRGMSLAIALLAVVMIGSNAMLIRKNLRRHKRMLGELDQKNKEKDRILRVVAHDLRSPVGGIKMMSGLLLGKDEAKQAEMITFIRRSATNCLELVNELLAGGFSGEGVIVDRAVFDVQQLVKESVQLMQFNAGEKNQVIEAVLPDEKQPILADAAKLGRVLNNILGNAIKFSPAGATIHVRLTGQGNRYRIAIRDHGIGIPPAAQGQVFEVFTLSRRPGTQGEKSFGLGLSISKQIIEAHGGKIWFESEEGKGTEFIIELPALG